MRSVKDYKHAPNLREKPRKEKNGFRVPSADEALAFSAVDVGSLGEGAERQIQLRGPLVAVIEAVAVDNDLERMWKKKSDAESGEGRESGGRGRQRR